MAAELKPCPFCGSKNAAPYSVKSCHSVLCVACGGEGPEADSEEGAIAAWNLRAPGVMMCQACAGDAPDGKCQTPRCVGGPIVQEIPDGTEGS